MVQGINDLIGIGIGANVEHPVYGRPRRTCGAAINALEKRDISIYKRSKWYWTKPILPSAHYQENNQTWYVNGLVITEVDISPSYLIEILSEVEKHFGRVRTTPNAPRTIDLDIIFYNQTI